MAKNFESKKAECDLTCSVAVDFMNDLEKAMKKGYTFITYTDEAYPVELRDIAYPPPYLFVRGNAELLKHPLKVCIAGSREATVYGMNVAANFAHELAENNACIVSGGARGIDTAAIRGAMRSGKEVIVVIGTGIDKDYPPENGELFEKVCESGGVIISEFPMGMGPLGRNFPTRNRVMTALSEAVVIVEAAERSGALISADHALEQGKTLFAVPSNIDSPNSRGVNMLLRDGANFALSGSDVLYELMEKCPEKYRQAQKFEAKADEEAEDMAENERENMACDGEDKEKTNHLSSYENAVVNAIKSGKDTYEEILEFTMMETNKLTSVLTIMEIKGIIKLAFRNRYKLED